MKISKITIIRNVRNYTSAQLMQIQDAICKDIVSGKLSTSWHEAIHAIDAELDRRICPPPAFWAISA